MKRLLAALALCAVLVVPAFAQAPSGGNPVGGFDTTTTPWTYHWLKTDSLGQLILSGGGSGGGSVTQGTSPWVVSAGSLPLPTGAATSALQPGFGTAGTPSANVSSIQGVVGGTALPVSVSSPDLPVGPTSVTSATTVVTLAMAGYYGVGVNITSAGSACTQVAEYSMDGGTTWTVAQLFNANTLAFSLSTTSTGQYAIICPGGVSNVHMRVSIYGSGTVTDQLRATAVTTPVTTVIGWTDGSQKTQITNSSGTPVTTPATSPGATDNGITVRNLPRKSLSITTTTPLTAGSTFTSSWQDTNDSGTVFVYADSLSDQASSSGGFIIQESNDTSNSGLTLSISSTTASANVVRQLSAQIVTRYWRISYTDGGTNQTSFELNAETSTAPTYSGGGLTTVGVTQSTTPWATSFSASATGGYTFSHIATNTTTTVKSGAGTLHIITINTLGATDTATIYDNTAGSGTVIGVINDAVAGWYTYDLAFTTGLTIVTSGTTAPDITVTYK